MTLFPFQSIPLIGLDIQPDALRLVQLKKTRQGYRLLQFAEERLAEDVFSGGQIKHWDALGAQLMGLAEGLQLKGEPTAICLPANVVSLQRLTLPAGLSDQDIEAEAIMHLQQEMPGLNEPLCIDFALLPATDAHSTYRDVMVAAVREAYLSSYVECVRVAGFNIKLVDVDSFAIKRALNVDKQWLRTPQDALAVLQIKQYQTAFIVFNAHETLFHQQWDTTDVDKSMAQLKNCLDVFLETFRSVAIRQLIICANRDDAKQIKKEAGAIVGCKTMLFDLSETLEVAENVNSELICLHAPEFLAAYGVAMREVPLW